MSCIRNNITPHFTFEDLTICYREGIAYQTDISQSVDYDEEYFTKYVSYENTEIANLLNQKRIELIKKYELSSILDIGVGSGEFIHKLKSDYSGQVYGYDINPLAINMLKEEGSYIDVETESLENIKGITFWDSLEHIPNPDDLLLKLSLGTYAFISIPIFKDLLDIKKSKHYRPNEHYYYFTYQGMINYMSRICYKIIEINDQETQAGREDILSFVFQKIDVESVRY